MKDTDERLFIKELSPKMYTLQTILRKAVLHTPLTFYVEILMALTLYCMGAITIIDKDSTNVLAGYLAILFSRDVTGIIFVTIGSFQLIGVAGYFKTMRLMTLLAEISMFWSYIFLIARNDRAYSATALVAMIAILLTITFFRVSSGINKVNYYN